MEISLETIRQVMHQRPEGNIRRLRDQTYLEEFKTRGFTLGDIAERYHENSKYIPEVMGIARRSVNEFERSYLRYVQSLIHHDYPGHALIDLPHPGVIPDIPLRYALERRRSIHNFGDEPMSLEQLSALSALAMGVTSSIEVEIDGSERIKKPLRAYPSAGALYPVEIYPVVLSCKSLPPGVYFYAAEEHGLRSIRTNSGDFMEEVSDAFISGEDPADIVSAGALFILTGAFWRSKAKYGPRGYRYILQESGHIAQNILLVAGGLGLNAVPVGSFYDDTVNDLIGVDGVDEAVIYVIAVGSTVEVAHGS